VAASRVHPFCNLQTRERTHAVLVIGLYELLGNPTTELTRALLRLCTYIDHIIVPDVMSNKPCQCRNTDYWTDDTLLINHVSAETLATGRSIPSGTNSPSSVVSTQLSRNASCALNLISMFLSHTQNYVIVAPDNLILHRNKCVGCNIIERIRSFTPRYCYALKLGLNYYVHTLFCISTNSSL
jgi:hypothetical protein